LENNDAATINIFIEDYPDMRELLERQLERMGYATISGTNGEEGLERPVRISLT
jgi:CheY-like chemotaxis protein